MERPPAMLAPVELALLVDGVIRYVERRLLSALGTVDTAALVV